MKRQLPKFILLGFISTFFVIIISIAISIYTYTSPDIEVDAAIVLGAAVWGEEPSPVFRERLNHAIDLYKNGTVSKIILTGGVGKGDKLAESEVGEEYIQDLRYCHIVFVCSWAKSAHIFGGKTAQRANMSRSASCGYP